MSILNSFLSDQNRAFAWEHRHDDWQKLVLSASRYPAFPVKDIALQIQCRQKAVGKLPHWAENPDVVFPGTVSLEQSSSERTAVWKASLMHGHTYVDLTGGMGVDFWAASQQFDTAVYCEQQSDLLDITRWNLKQIGVDTDIEWVNGDGMQWLADTDQTFDWIYLDPARRDRTRQKVVQLEDCEPNVLAYQDLLLTRAPNVLVKASPMLDIDLAIRQLGCVANVYVVAVDDEVKELLFHLTSVSQEPTITAVNLLKDGSEQRFSFTRMQEQTHTSRFSGPLQYLYEPNAAILKAGAFKQITAAYPDLCKLAPSSHLYTSTELIRDFPGRSFQVIDTVKADKKEVRMRVPLGKANLSVRNFPMSVADLRKKLALAEGGEFYLFATSDVQQKKFIVVTTKIY